MSDFEINTIIDIVVNTAILTIVFSFMVSYLKKKESKSNFPK